MQTILITGGSGMLGTYLSKVLLEKGYKVIIVGRSKQASNQPNLQYFTWNLESQTIDENAIKQADVIVNLAGANVGSKRWTAKRKTEIIDSRVKAGNLIIKSLKNIPNNVRTIVQASATGWYKNNGNTANVESEAANTDFLGSTCKLWEESITPVEQLNKRLIIHRFGIILSNNGGAFKEFLKPAKFKFAPILGNGNQQVSWIHIHDAAMSILFSIEQQHIKGIFNTVSPNVTTNKNLMHTIAKMLNGNFYFSFHVPSFLIKIIFGEMSEEVLKSTNASALKLVEAGFNFSYPTLHDGIHHLIENKNI
ncbi:MAG: TIGR01777 family oxidoreductase [Chitinophagaceae bacterium]